MQEKIPFEFSELKSPNVSKAKMQQGDVVRIASSDLNYLEEFYTSRYDGTPLKMFAKQFSIAILNDSENAKSSLMRNTFFWLFVRAIREGQFIQVDLFVDSLNDSVIWTEVLNNSDPVELLDGIWSRTSYTIHYNDRFISDDMRDSNAFTTYVNCVVSYVLFYMQENISNPEYVEKTTMMHTETVSKSTKKNGKKKNTKKKVRQTVYVPKCIVINTSAQSVDDGEEAETAIENTTDETTANTAGKSTAGTGKRTYTGHTECWFTRGHKRRIVRKDGTVEFINVKPSIHVRDPNLLLKGMEKGRDIKLRKRRKEK